MLAAILAFNTGEYIHKVVDALKKHPFRIIVIDNGSEPPIKVSVPTIRLEKGCGIIHGRNLGFSLRTHKGEGVLAIADDVVVPEGEWSYILEREQELTLALRPQGDIAFTQYNRFDDPQEYPDFIKGAPTSFQCVYFPGPVLDRIGMVDERYIWGDDGLMMRKNPHAVLRNYTISPNQGLDRGPKYRPLRNFYEELWRPGKIDGEYWDTFPIRYTLEQTHPLVSDKCPTLWTMHRDDNPVYYDISKAIKEAFEKIWENPTIDRKPLLEDIRRLSHV